MDLRTDGHGWFFDALGQGHLKGKKLQGLPISFPSNPNFGNLAYTLSASPQRTFPQNAAKTGGLSQLHFCQISVGNCWCCQVNGLGIPDRRSSRLSQSGYTLRLWLARSLSRARRETWIFHISHCQTDQRVYAFHFDGLAVALGKAWWGSLVLVRACHKSGNRLPAITRQHNMI